MSGESAAERPAGTQGRHVAGLDALRFAAAGWVALSHGLRLPIDRLAEGSGVGRALGALNNGMFNGVAAVMVFFVISGLVIHLPQALAQRSGVGVFSPLNHWVRRLTRILPPVIVATLLVRAMGQEHAAAFRGILWSIWCEIAYYALYPALLLAFRRFSTRATFLATTALSLAAIAATWPTAYHSQLDILPLAIIGLPSWILGCMLAERICEPRPLPTGEVWLWRLAALALSAAMKVPVTHGPLPIGYPAGHWLFAIFAYFWLMREIGHFRSQPPPASMERLGAMSYSLYLIHMPVIAALAAIPAAALSPSPAAAEMVRWAIQLGAVAGAMQLFYFGVEAPSHRLARRLGRLAAGASTAPARG